MAGTDARREYPAGIGQFKEYFFRDFPYSGSTDGVMDRDIAKAYGEAMFLFNPGLFSDAERPAAFMVLAAHFLVLDLKAGAAGVRAEYGGILAAKSAGSVSASYSVPAWAMESPELSGLAQTQYGARYLSLAAARCRGGFAVVQGATRP